MKSYRIQVIRKQEWLFDVEAVDVEQAKNIAEEMACQEDAHDDYAYETKVVW